MVERRTHATKPGFDESMAGKRAECDGGGQLVGTQFGVRHEFAGVLTGDYIDHGDPPWRWYLMRDLYLKPDGWPGEEVWCESQMIWLQPPPATTTTRTTTTDERSESVGKAELSESIEKAEPSKSLK